MSQGMEVTELRAETTILRDLNLGQRTTALVAELNKHATLSSFIVDEERAELRYQTRLYTHFAVHTLAKELFLHASVLQVAEAHRRMDSLSEYFESPIAVSNHPDMQIRDEPDGMLAVIDDVYAPQGTRESRWPDEEFSAVAEMDPSPAVKLTKCQHGLTAEVGCPTVSSDGESEQSMALLTVDTSAQHFDLGNGCLLRLRLPMHVYEEYGPSLCAELNRAELTEWTGAHLAGAWSWDFSDGLVFCTFLPNGAYVPGTVSLLLWASAGRAAWVSKNYDRLLAAAAVHSREQW
jgi:hypothetical protein